MLVRRPDGVREDGCRQKRDETLNAWRFSEQRGAKLSQESASERAPSVEIAEAIVFLRVAPSPARWVFFGGNY